MKHQYKVGDRAVIIEKPLCGDFSTGDVVTINEIGDGEVWVKKGGGEFGVRYSRLIPFREVSTFPALPEGVQVGDEVEVSNNKNYWCRSVLETITADGRFVTKKNGQNSIYVYCRAIPKTITRFKSLGFLISDLERRGYVREGANFFINGKAKGYSIEFLLGKAGVKYRGEENVYSQWLEEVQP